MYEAKDGKNQWNKDNRENSRFLKYELHSEKKFQQKNLEKGSVKLRRKTHRSTLLKKRKSDYCTENDVKDDLNVYYFFNYAIFYILYY